MALEELQLEELQTEIDSLKQRVVNLEQPKLDDAFIGNQLKFPLDTVSEKIVEDIIRKRIIDIAWNDYFYYPETFNSLDSLSESIVGTSGSRFTATAQPVYELFTGASTNDGVLTGKHVFQQTLLTFDKKQRFRTHFSVDSVTAVTANITIGPDGYGFRVTDNSLIGFVTDDGSSETTITLQTIALDTTYFIEAVFSPKDGVRFIVNGIERGFIQGGLPTGVHTNLWSLELKTTEAVAKNMLVQMFELIQKR